MKVSESKFQKIFKKQLADERCNAIQAAFVRMGLPKPEPEYYFHPSRKWRFDYAWSEYRVALEVEGGVWSGGRHTRASGFLGDMEKYNSAAALGWRVLRCTPQTVTRIDTINTIKEALAA